jgi:diguanylate cyclase (GGDEF)-like protein
MKMKLEKRFYDVAIQYLDAYFIKRDYDEVMKFLDKNLLGFGTGLDEVAYIPEEFRDLFKRDMKLVQEPINYTLINDKVMLYESDFAVFMCQMNITGNVDGVKFSLNQLRQTLVMQIVNDEVKIIHLHISFPTKEHEDDEPYPLKELEDITKMIEQKVKEKTWSMMKAYRELERAVITDKLTQLYNRNRIDDLLLYETNRSSRYGTSFSFVIIDIDHFKVVNDEHGHLFGDKILVELANLIRTNIRDTDFAGRWGGEEFVVILPETKANMAINYAEKLRMLIENLIFDKGVKITASFGVTSYMDGDNVESIFERSDKALYKAKADGRNRTVYIS